jgi:hypothetical protein
MSGYSSSKEPSKPPIESVAGYKAGKEPAAAAFGRGAKNVAEIREATEARREHSRQLTNKPTGPRGSAIGHDARE